MKCATFFLTILGVLLGGAGVARAGVVLYSQATDLGSAYASQNDLTGGFGNYATAFDNFTLGSAGTVTSVQWTGSYFNGPPEAISSFALTFYADNAGTPGTALDTTTIFGNAGETSVGTDFSGDPAFSYTADLTPPFSAAGGTQYWLSIVPTVGFPPQWGWETGTGGDGAAYQVAFGSGAPIPNDLAFELDGSGGTAPTPEPASLTLFGVGIAGMAGYSWCRRKLVTA